MHFFLDITAAVITWVLIPTKNVCTFLGVFNHEWKYSLESQEPLEFKPDPDVLVLDHITLSYANSVLLLFFLLWRCVLRHVKSHFKWSIKYQTKQSATSVTPYPHAYLKCANLCAEARIPSPFPYNLSTTLLFIHFSYSNPRGGGRVRFSLWPK